MIRFVIATLFCIALIQTGQAQSEPQFEAKIDTVQAGDMTTISALFINHGVDERQFSYQLKVERDGKNGSSANTQSGKFSAQPGKECQLSQSTINITSGDQYTFSLTVMDAEGQVIAEKTITENQP